MEARLLTLDEATQRALIYSPAVAIVETAWKVRQSEEYQASFLPNPLASVEIDKANLIGKEKKRARDRGFSCNLSQSIELGGKRHLRKQTAGLQTSLAFKEIEVTRLEVSCQVKKAFIEVAAAQEYLRFAQELQLSAQEVFFSTSAKVEGGKISSLKGKKAKLSVLTAHLALEKARNNFENSKKKLALIWGDSRPDFTSVDYNLLEITLVEDLAAFIAEQNDNIATKQWDLQIANADLLIASEKAQRIPNLVVTAGYVSSAEDGEGLLLGFSMAIPIWDRNQGNISKAKHLLKQLYNKRNKDNLQARLQLEAEYAQLLTAYQEGLLYNNDVLPIALATFEGAKQEYLQGKNDYLELLEAQRTLLDVHDKYMHALVDYHQRKIELYRLVRVGYADTQGR
ncbi:MULTISPECIES: TolC family protein [unclassified Neochlamydia]|uniref:TolC family protein n=1 Tax=unclassified Neochlamydia TaxID=2643326 RepID=UPI00140A5360|nr:MULTISPECIES: TolC family protein [unclassified Neochlamydia]